MTEVQASADRLVSNFIGGCTDLKTTAALLGAGWLGRTVRLGAMASLFPSAASLPALAAESAAFAALERGFHRVEGKDWAKAAVTLTGLKLFGGLTRGQNILLEHFLTDLGLVAGQHAAYLAHFTDKPQGTFSQQMLQAEVMNWNMKCSLAFAQGLVPSLSATERSLDLFFTSQEAALFSQQRPSPFFSPLAFVTGGRPEGLFADFRKGEESKGPEMVKMSAQDGKGGKMNSIRGEKFSMGSNKYKDTQPVRRISVSGFLISRSLVTNAEHQKYVEAQQSTPFVLMKTAPERSWTTVVDQGASPEAVLPRNLRGEVKGWDGSSPFIGGGFILLKVGEPRLLKGFDRPNQPAVWINWYEALAHAAWAVKGGRLPTEAEWEKAGRSISHMEGSVWQWTMDWYQDSYRGLSDQNPIGPPQGLGKVLRGGFRGNPRCFPWESYRWSADPTALSTNIGFRIVTPVSQDSH